jgi:hypothetical protein
LAGLDKNLLKRTKDYKTLSTSLFSSPDADAGDGGPSEHDGASLWRKFKDIKKVVLNYLTPKWSKILKNGIYPSGMNKDDVLLAIRKEYFNEIESQASKTPSSSTHLRVIRGRTLLMKRSCSLVWK